MTMTRSWLNILWTNFNNNTCFKFKQQFYYYWLPFASWKFSKSKMLNFIYPSTSSSSTTPSTIFPSLSFPFTNDYHSFHLIILFCTCPLSIILLLSSFCSRLSICSFLRNIHVCPFVYMIMHVCVSAHYVFMCPFVSAYSKCVCGSLIIIHL